MQPYNNPYIGKPEMSDETRNDLHFLPLYNPPYNPLITLI